MQSLALVLLLVGARHGWLPLYLALPLGVALLWLPWLLPGNRTAVATVGEPDIARLARDLSHNTSQNALSAAGVAFSVKRLAEKLQSQLDAAEQIVGSAEVMIHTERATSNLARQAMDAATRARAGSDEGQVLLASTIERMHRLSERMGASREAIEALNQRSEDIQRVTLVIQGIASQTNLLALNAAIEAARAGEHGRGFAVVAEEVRGLAGRTAEATEEVGQMVAEIQRQTSEVVEQIRQLSEELGEGVGQVELTGRQLEGIAELGGRGGEPDYRDRPGRRDQPQPTRQPVRRGRASARRPQRQRGTDPAPRRSRQPVGEPGRGDQRAPRRGQPGRPTTSRSTTSPGRARRLSPLASRRTCAAGASTSTTCSTAATSRCPIPSRPSTGPASTATPTRSCRASRSSCWSATANLVFAIACTPEGYVPTHNRAFAHPPSGDPQTDALRSRSKRLFNDRTGIRCGSHQQPLLLQTYTRDTGELMHDLSVPIFIHGKHWGRPAPRLSAGGRGAGQGGRAGGAGAEPGLERLAGCGDQAAGHGAGEHHLPGRRLPGEQGQQGEEQQGEVGRAQDAFGPERLVQRRQQ
ncbi:putative chemotaxis transducer [Pseudomonas aeruginosa]|nr:putative chemotaxis transducer [Pseudomonas aeruginosa]